MTLRTDDLHTFSENKQLNLSPVFKTRIYCFPEYDYFVQNTRQFTYVKIEVKVYFRMVIALQQA